MVDAHVSGACVERHAGSSPVLGTSVGRAQPCQGWGREFESRFPLIASRIFHDAEIAQLVEHNLAKVRVASSSLVFRSVNLLRGQLHWFLFFCVFFFPLFPDFILC